MDRDPAEYRIPIAMSGQLFPQQTRSIGYHSGGAVNIGLVIALTSVDGVMTI
jgi:hypothetical protein